MNHFFAIELSPAARQAVVATVEQWKPLLSPAQAAKWYVPEDYHVTLKFLGDLPETAQPELIASALLTAALTAPFEVGLTGTGAFPSLARPNVIWVGVRDAPPLTALAARLEAALAAVGHLPERRPYRPHVTVARCRPARTAGEWPAPSEHLFPFWRVTRFVLMQTVPPESRANGTKARYNNVHTFPFGGAHSSNVS